MVSFPTAFWTEQKIGVLLGVEGHLGTYKRDDSTGFRKLVKHLTEISHAVRFQM